MIGSVNLSGMKPFNSAENKKYSVLNQQCKNLQFGYREQSQSPLQSLKDTVLMFTDNAVGMIGMNMVIWWMQSFVNGKILSGKINERFTKNIKDKSKLASLAYEMLDKHELKDKVKIFQGNGNEAYFTHIGNEIVVGKNQYSSLFHEIGHAVIENKTKVLKMLQRFRTNTFTRRFGGNYTLLSLALYALFSQRQKQDGEDQSIGSKISKSDAIIPLLAYSPELITEAKASQEGLKFLKQKLNAGAIEKSLYKNIKKSYITCFATYLFIPVSIILIDMLRNSANNARRKRMMRQNQFYS